MDVSTIPVKLLVVDDLPAHRAALRAILSSSGCEIFEATSAVRALRMLLDDDYALLLVGDSLPEMTGIELATLVRSRGRTAAVPIVMVSSHGADLDRVYRGYRAGAADYLTTPFVAEIVRAKVGVFAQLYRQRKALEQQAEKERELGALEQRLAGERRYRNLAEAVPNMIWTARPDGTLDYVNLRWLEYTGRSLAHMDGSWASAVHADDRDACVAAWWSAVARGDMLDVECRLVRADGAVRWHLCRAAPERGATSEIVGWLGSFTDIDDERRARAVLAEFKGTLDAVMDAVLIFEPDDWRLLYANQGASALLGYDRDALLALAPGEFVVEMDAIAARIGELDRDARSILALETTLRHRDRRTLPVEMSLHVIRIDTHARRVVAIARDITERLRARRERELLYRDAVEAIRARDEFLSVASHELRTPLSALQLQIEMLLHPPRRDPNATVSPEQLRRKLEIAARQVDRLTRLIGELLDVSRITVGRLRLDRAETDLATVARDVVGRFADEAARAKTAIALSAGEPVVGVWDRLRLEQIITNLVSNAIKFGGGKPIEVEVSGDDESARLVVVDHGIGIAPRDVERVFHRYEQAVATRAYGGLGLGLYIVRGIVEAHGGTIRVDSQIGEGSTFTVELPRNQPPEHGDARDRESRTGHDAGEASADR